MTMPSEPIRQWYRRTTRRARVALVISTMVGIAITFGVYFLASHEFNLHLQVFNGAYTIPLAAAIWIASFVYIFLVPSREVGFRSQESIEETVKILRESLDEKVGPAVAVWKRIGERVESELPWFIGEARTTLSSLKEISSKLDQASAKNEKFAEEIRPVIEALKRIEAKVEQDGILDEARVILDGLKTMTVPKGAVAHDIDFALASIGKRKKP